MEFRNFIRNTRKNMSESYLRFPAAVLLTVALAIVNILLIYNVIDEAFPDLFLSLILGIEAGLLLPLAAEKKIIRTGRLVANSVAMLVCLLSFLLLQFVDLEDYVALGYGGVIMALFMLILTVLYKDNDDKPVLSFMIQSALYCGFAMAVAYVGLIICLLAFNYLVYSFDKLLELIFSLTDIVAAMFFIMLLSYVPDENTRIVVSKSFSNIFNKIGFTVYLLLIGVLYIYIIKIIVTWKMPVGRLNWFGSLALLFYVLFYLGLVNEEGQIQKMFIKYGGLLLLPILLIQLYAIYIRLDAYGLTVLRYLSVILIVFAVLFIINSLFRFRISLIFAIGCLMSILATIGPLNMVDVPNREQSSRLLRLADKYQLIVDGKYRHSDNMTEDDREAFISCYEYLKYSGGKLADKVKIITDLSYQEVVGSEDYVPVNTKWIYYYASDHEIDISSYQKAVYVNSYYYDDVHGLNVHDEIMKIYQKYGSGQINDSILIIEIDDNNAIAVQELSVEIVDDEGIGYFFIEGYLLIGGEQ